MRDFKSEKITPPRSIGTLLSKNQIAEWREQSQNVDLEIGAGVGWHAIQYAVKNPLRKLIAIERTKEKFLKFEGRINKHPFIENLFAIHADVVHWSVYYLPDESIDRIFILYPNLYPKNASARFFRMPFFNYLLGKCKKNATIHLATNDFVYQIEAQNEAQERLGMKLIHFNELNGKNLSEARTHFEKKYLLRDQTCYDLIFQK